MKRALQNGGGLITATITIAAGKAIVRRADHNLLVDDGGSVSLTKDWAQSILYGMNFVERRGCSTAKISLKNFEDGKEQFLLDLKAVIKMEEIPSALVFNWDQTGISIVPVSSWTLELKGSKRVDIVGIDDKRQFRLCFCGTLSGEFKLFS